MDKQIAEIRKLMETHLRIRGRDLTQQTRRAGRLLPRKIRNDLNYIEQARAFLDHPKLHLMVDHAKVEEAQERVVAHLKSIDAADRRKGRLLGVAGVISFNLIVLFVLVMGVLLWRGFV